MDDKLAALLKTQKSLTEWLEDVKHQYVDAIRAEDNDKRERLKVLNEVINLPYDVPVQFQASDLAFRTPEFLEYLENNGNEPCALRLIPKADGLPKMRMRGKSVKDAYKWFQDQDIDPDNYLADFTPHPPDYSWATIFIVNQHGAQGEIIWGGHHQLTQGFHDGDPPMVFRYDFQSWEIDPYDEKALSYLKNLIPRLLVLDSKNRHELEDRLNASFSHNYLEGYFETTDSSLGTWFIDYSPTLGQIYADTIFKAKPKGGGIASGLIGSPGKAEGRVKIVHQNNLDVSFEQGSILVCEMTTPEYVPLMLQAAAIITDQGGILSHAAIVARELKKPCIVGTGNATKVLKDGQHVFVDATIGVVS